MHIALTGLLGYRPDLVVSGINNGANMGDDTIYSGTVGAAMEGFLFGIPAIAFSQVEKGWGHLDAAAAKARELVAQMLQQQLVGTKPWLLNVNIPNLPLDADQADEGLPARAPACGGAGHRAGKPARRNDVLDRQLPARSRTMRKARISTPRCRAMWP